MASDIKLIGDSVIIEGMVGIGTSSPQSDLHVHGQCTVQSLRGSFLGRPQLLVSCQSIALQNPAFKPDSGIGVALAHTDKDELALNESNNYKGGVKITGKLTVNGDVQVNGVIKQSSSREVKENITPFTGREAIQALGGLNPVKFTYKGAEHQEQRVGFVAEDSPGLVTTSERRSVAVMDVIAVLTKVVQQQQEVISRIGEEVEELRRRCGQLPDARPPQTRNA